MGFGAARQKDSQHEEGVVLHTEPQRLLVNHAIPYVTPCMGVRVRNKQQALRQGGDAMCKVARKLPVLRYLSKHAKPIQPRRNRTTVIYRELGRDP
jgi:hypothetical protein